MTAAPATAIAGTLIAAAIDLRTGLIPDPISGTTALVALAAAALNGTLPTALAGSVAAGGALWLLHAATGGRGLGLGDVKLGAAIGAALGPAAAFVALGAAFTFGALAGIALLLARRATRRSALPFAPFLALGTLAGAVLQPWAA
ncbi:MAG TPA: A24 family peptidase [Candidatus Sulfotelmatobacter sp.]|nr:A24 family peptidase [Candidatus Sulfotelmatobacter sp.]